MIRQGGSPFSPYSLKTTNPFIFQPPKNKSKMKNKTVILILSVLAVAMYTVAVINFCLGNVLGGIGDVLMASSDALMAYALYRVGQLGRMADKTRKAVIALLEQLTKGVPATLTLKDGKGTITLGHDDDGDPHPANAPEEELTDEEKRIRRMAEEYDQLTERYGKLTDFLTTYKFGTLPENTQTLLKRQHQAMHDYRDALRQRIRIDAEAANLKVEINDPDDE